MAKQTFTTGQVLTAAQMTSLQQTAMGGGSATAKTSSYVLVAADAGTTVAMNAAGSTTITVNTGLFAAGDTVFIQNLGAGACTVTAGTATVATAGSLILPQNDAGILYFTATGTAIFYDYIQAGAVSPLTTKGDVYTFSTSDARLAVGANDTVLTADSAQATGLKWATPSAGGMTLISTTSLTSTSVTISSIPQTYNNLYIIIKNFFSNTANRKMIIKPNGTSSIANFTYNAFNGAGTDSSGANGTDLTTLQVSESTDALRNIYVMNIYNYTDAVAGKVFDWKGTMADNSSCFNFAGTFTTATTISSLVFTLNGAGSFNGGSVLLYGVK